VLGFLTGRIVVALQLDHIYTAEYFLLLLALLGASLTACTITNQWPAVKVARRWRFKGEQASLARLEVASRVPDARLVDVGRVLAAKNYQVSCSGPGPASKRGCGVTGVGQACERSCVAASSWKGAVAAAAAALTHNLLVHQAACGANCHPLLHSAASSPPPLAPP
jgi:hypothetical protein